LVVPSRHRTGRGLWTLDTAGSWQGLELGATGRGGAGATGCGAAGVAARLRWLGIHLRRNGRGGRGDPALRLAVSEPGALDAEPAMEPDHLQRLVHQLHPQSHDVGDGVHGSADGDLPSMVVLDIPATDLG